MSCSTGKTLESGKSNVVWAINFKWPDHLAVEVIYFFLIEEGFVVWEFFVFLYQSVLSL